MLFASGEYHHRWSKWSRIKRMLSAASLASIDERPMTSVQEAKTEANGPAISRLTQPFRMVAMLKSGFVALLVHDT